jgi:hypothetical protein
MWRSLENSLRRAERTGEYFRPGRKSFSAPGFPAQRRLWSPFAPELVSSGGDCNSGRRFWLGNGRTRPTRARLPCCRSSQGAGPRNQLLPASPRPAAAEPAGASLVGSPPARSNLPTSRPSPSGVRARTSAIRSAMHPSHLLSDHLNWTPGSCDGDDCRPVADC